MPFPRKRSRFDQPSRCLGNAAAGSISISQPRRLCSRSMPPAPRALPMSLRRWSLRPSSSAGLRRCGGPNQLASCLRAPPLVVDDVLDIVVLSLRGPGGRVPVVLWSFASRAARHGGHHRLADRGHVPVVGAAAAAEDAHRREASGQPP